MPRRTPVLLLTDIELPWREMRGMRNLIMHEYFRVSIDRVHDTIQYDLPALLAQLRLLADRD